MYLRHPVAIQSVFLNVSYRKRALQLPALLRKETRGLSVFLCVSYCVMTHSHVRHGPCIQGATHLRDNAFKGQRISINGCVRGLRIIHTRDTILRNNLKIHTSDNALIQPIAERVARNLEIISKLCQHARIPPMGFTMCAKYRVA